MLLIAFLFFFSKDINAQEKKIQTATIKTTINCDHCKACETCGQLFNQKLLKEPGVQMVVLDEEKMTIKVTYNKKKRTWVK